MEAPVVVAGDVHLHEDDPAGVERFLAWVASLAGRCKHLVLLGDVFDRWVGRAQAGTPLGKRVVETLKALRTAGVSLAFQGGNRDFAFDGAEGLEIDVWPDVVRTRWGSRTVLLTHGDLLCTADGRYQAMRRVVRSRPARAALAALPMAAADYIARGLRDVSRRETRAKPYASMGIDYRAARTWLDAAGADVLVAGHVHTGVHHRLPGETTKDVFVLKDWEAGGGVVRFDGSSIALVPPDAV
jgi:UDP-2,3-diacylglucosamine hydrolase